MTESKLEKLSREQQELFLITCKEKNLIDDYGDIEVTADKDDPTKVNISFWFRPIAGIPITFGEPDDANKD